MNTEEVALLIALLALLALVPALLAVVVLALAVRSYERLYRLVQALLVGLISEVDLTTAGEMLVREAVGDGSGGLKGGADTGAAAREDWPDG